MGFVKTFEEILAKGNENADFYDAEMLTVFWETTPGIVEKLLPPPLKPAETPLVCAFVANYPATNFDCVYLESALFLRATFDGQEGNYCLAMPVTSDIAMAGGREIFGYPKKIANIEMKRDGNIVEGWTERRGIRFMKVRGNLTGKINEDSEMDQILRFGMTPEGVSSILTYNFKHFPSPEAGGTFDYSPRLIKEEVVFQPKEFKFGEAEIDLIPSDYDPWHEVPVVRMLGAIYTVGDNTMLKGKVMAEVDPLEFAPYAFLKWDMA